MGLPQGFEWIIVLVVALIIFGPKNLPKIGRAIGQSIRGFKDEMKGITDNDEDDDSTVKSEKSTSADESKK
jgi:sec-independent protein translocase protein TatA